MKIKILIGILVLLNTIQAQTSNDIKNDIPKVIPPSPNAAALGKFGEIPVNHSTGIPSIGHPIYSWSKGKLNINVGLSYHAGGVKVEDIPSDVGLGWALTGIGRVSRTVRGIPDDDPLFGYLYTNPLPLAATGGQIPSIQNGFSYAEWSQAVPDLGADEAISVYNSPTNHGVLSAISRNEMDSEQDIFNFNINGKSGKFFIKKNLTIVFLEHTNVKVSFQTHPLNHPTVPLRGRIYQFTIIDDNGIKYVFNELENQTSEQVTIGNTILQTNPISSYTSSWLIHSVSDEQTKDSIKYEYEMSGQSYESGFAESMNLTLIGTQGVPSNNSQNFDLWQTKYFDTDYGLQESDISSSYSKINASVKKVKKIILNNEGYIDLNYTANNRLDLVSDKALEEIEVFNNRGKKIKKLTLVYDYFDNAAQASGGVGYNYGNSFTKRLKLTEVKETTNGQSIKTTFEYNPTLLNRRDSKNKDLWGYNINPSRNNYTLIPKIPIATEDLPITPYASNDFLGGADRNPDADYCKAGVLEKITYPTGGFTQFEFEPNKAFSALNYYEDTKLTDHVSFSDQEWNQNKSITFTNRLGLSVLFNCKATEPNPRVPGGPPHNCLENQQDAFICKFVITSTDNTVYQEIQNTYGNFLAGYSKRINLPLNKIYQVKFIYNYTLTCDYEFPFTIKINGQFTIEPEDKLVGGVRVKKIINHDGLGNTVVKEYSYNGDNNKSSATVYRVPNFRYYKTTKTVILNYGLGYNIGYGRYFNRSSSPTQSLEYINGSPMLYTKVTEFQTNLGKTVREFDTYGNAFYAEDSYPYFHDPMIDFMGNLITKETVYDQANTKKMEKTYTYNKIWSNASQELNLLIGSVGSSPLGNAIYRVKGYYHHAGRSELISTTTKAYENGNVITTTEDKTYDPSLYYVRTITATNSNNEQLKTEYKYPFDLMNGSNVYTSMFNNNNISPIVEQKQTNITQNAEISKSIINYSPWNSNTLFAMANMQSSVKGGPTKTLFTVEQYDDKGNILQAIDKSGMRVAYIWGYNKTHPVAQITNATYANAVSYINTSLINNPHTTDAAMRTELHEIRTGLAGTNAQVTTYTYEPLIGMTSQTNPQNKTQYFEYDGFNRLTTIRNQDGNIVKKICYKYNGQQEDCGLYYSIALSQNFTRNNCPAGQTGSTVTFTVSGGMFSSAISQADADLQALNYINANGQAYANTNGTCTPNNVCTNCTGPDKKCINNECELGMRVNTNTYYDSYTGKWWCVYHYEWSDGSWSVDYEEENNNPCL